MTVNARRTVQITILVVISFILIGCVSTTGPMNTDTSSVLSPTPSAVYSPVEPASITPSSGDSAMLDTSIGNWTIGMPESDLEESLTSNGIAYQLGNDETGQLWYRTDDISFGMGQENSAPSIEDVVISMNVKSDTYATSLGVRVGDPQTKVDQLYGDGYDHDDYLLCVANAWEYQNNGIYLRFLFDANLNVIQWGIATYSLLDL